MRLIPSRDCPLMHLHSRTRASNFHAKELPRNLTSLPSDPFTLSLLCCRSGLISVPNNAKVHYNYANLQKDSGNLKLAEAHYRTAIRYAYQLPSSLAYSALAFSRSSSFRLSFFLSLSLSHFLVLGTHSQVVASTREFTQQPGDDSE